MLSFSVFLEDIVASQGCHAGSWHGSDLDAANDEWDICIVLRQTVNCFEVSFVQPSEDIDAVVNAGSSECRVLHEVNSSPME